jgi:hypothetical protein
MHGSRRSSAWTLNIHDSGTKLAAATVCAVARSAMVDKLLLACGHALSPGVNHKESEEDGGRIQPPAGDFHQDS